MIQGLIARRSVLRSICVAAVLAVSTSLCSAEDITVILKQKSTLNSNQSYEGVFEYHDGTQWAPIINATAPYSLQSVTPMGFPPYYIFFMYTWGGTRGITGYTAGTPLRYNIFAVYHDPATGAVTSKVFDETVSVF